MTEYFKDNKLIKILRFLNLLEPEYNVLSVTKLYMWVMLFVVIYVLLLIPTNLNAVMAATGGQMLAMANYSYRKWLDKKTDYKNVNQKEEKKEDDEK